MPYRFEWDSRKAATNIRKHGVRFDEASTVFVDPMADIFEDDMKTTSTPKLKQDAADELRPEYSFDYRKARPNRFAGQVDKSQVVVILDPDVSEVFTTPESVNAILRALIKTMPASQTKSARRPPAESTHQPALR